MVTSVSSLFFRSFFLLAVPSSVRYCEETHTSTPCCNATRGTPCHLAHSLRLRLPASAWLQEMVDLYGYLLRNRVVFLNQRISDTVAIQVVASLLALDSIDSDAEIKLYINCPQVGVRRYNGWYISA